MVIERPRYPKQRNVMIVNDQPTKKELEEEEKFSAPSNINLLTSLRTGRVTNYTNEPSTHKGIILTDIFTTYLDYEGFVEGNFDYSKEVVKGKSREEGQVYHQLLSQKDTYVADRLWNQFQSLLEEIRTVQPKFIIVTGKWSLFFLTGVVTLAQTAGNAKDRKPFGGVVKYRSSILQPHEVFGLQQTIVMPIYHPVNAIGMPDKAPIMQLDMEKIGYMYHTMLEKGVEYYIKPEKKYILGTTKEIVFDYLNSLLHRLESSPRKVSIDIETVFHTAIDCIGITDSIDEGICIPFATKTNPNFFSIEDEIEVQLKIREVLTHPNCLHVGQNYQYDCQYFYKLQKLSVKAKEDTLVKHHILYNYLPKDLAFMASLYCEFYTYWKDQITLSEESPETRWIYNVKDCCYTLEVDNVLDTVLAAEPTKRQDLYRFQIDRTSPLLVEMMNRGIRMDVEEKDRLYQYFSGLLNDIRNAINAMLGFEFNLNSTPQKKKVFQDFLGITLKTQKKKGGEKVETCNAAAMLEYLEEYPLYRPFLGLLLEYNAIKVFTTNFLGMKLDEDGRARTQYRIAGTGTGRLASTKNVWDTGGNLQNIPEKGKLKLKYVLELLNIKETTNYSEDEATWDEFIEASILEDEIEA
jgi:hypothetical protein